MDSLVGNKILDSNMDSATVGGGTPSIVPGKMGASLQLNARRRDFVDLGSFGHSCLGNLSVCLDGLTAAMWLRFDALRDDMHYLSTGVEGLHLYYRCVSLSHCRNGLGRAVGPLCVCVCPDNYTVSQKSVQPLNCL